MENLYFSRGHGRNFDYLVFDHSYFEILAMVMVKNLWPQYMTMTPGRRSNGRKIKAICFYHRKGIDKKKYHWNKKKYLEMFC